MSAKLKCAVLQKNSLIYDERDGLAYCQIAKVHRIGEPVLML